VAKDLCSCATAQLNLWRFSVVYRTLRIFTKCWNMGFNQSSWKRR